MELAKDSDIRIVLIGRRKEKLEEVKKEEGNEMSGPVFKLENGGQVSFSTTRPGITRGNHYHIRKNEKFCVVSGQASIKLRRIGTDTVIEYRVSGDKPAWVEMPIYHTHNITNTGSAELVTLFWINEHFDPNDPDTFFEEV